MVITKGNLWSAGSVDVEAWGYIEGKGANVPRKEAARGYIEGKEANVPGEEAARGYIEGKGANVPREEVAWGYIGRKEETEGRTK